MELIIGDLFERYELVDSGIVHQHVEPVEGLLRFRKQPLHVGALCDIAFDSNGLTAICSDVADNAVCALLVGRVVHHDCGAWLAQALGDRRTDAFRCAGYDRHLVLQTAHWNSSWAPLQSPSWDVCRNMNSGRYTKSGTAPTAISPQSAAVAGPLGAPAAMTKIRHSAPTFCTRISPRWPARL